MQCVRRSQVDLRKLLQIAPRRTAAAAGLAATACARLTADSVWQARCDWLAQEAVEGSIR